MRKQILGLSILFVVSLFGSSFSLSNQIDKPQYAKPGMVAYAASYDTVASNEPQYASQKSKTFDYLSLGDAHSYYRGDSVKVGIIDSGINYDHEDFMVNNSTVVKGDSKYYAYETSGWVYYGATQHGYTYIDDTLGHGTNVAATVAAAINGVGGTGIAPNVELYVYKVTNSNNGYEFGAIQNALMDAVNLKLDVINMSFQSYENAVSYGSSSMAASSGCSTILSYYLNQAHNAGITLVGAAGNYNTSEPSYPGSNDYVINVGSLAANSNNTKAGFSNYGSTIDLVAPGYVRVADKTDNSGYKETSGTSFSAPLVTGAIALYIQQNPSATPDEIESALYASCDPISGTNWAGNGALNIEKFLSLDSQTKVDVTGVSLDRHSITLAPEEEDQLTATISPSNATVQTVTYTSSDEDVVMVDDTGYLLAVDEGTATITVTTEDGGFTDTATITVTNSTPTPTPTSETSDIDLAGGSHANSQITWTSEDKYTTVTQMKGTGQTDVSSSYVSAPRVYKGHILKFQADSDHKITKIEITYDGSYSGNSMTAGTVLSGTTVTDNDTAVLRTWSTTSGGTHVVESKSSEGLSTIYIQNVASTNVQLRPTKITITYAASQPKVTNISLDKTAATLDLYNTYTVTLTPTVLYETGATTTVTWSSSDTTVASISITSGSKDTPITVTGLKVGTSTITATSGSKSATCTITVIDSSPVPVTQINLDKTSLSLVKNASTTLTATVLPNNATDKSLTWSTSNSSIVNISSTSGNTITITVLGNPGQSATITVSSNDGSGVSNQCVVTVIEAVTLTSISISGHATSVPYMSTYSTSGIVITATYSDNTSKNVTSSATCTNSIDTSILGNQPLTYSYTEEGITKTASVTVKVTNNGASGNVGTSSGDVLTPHSPVTWSFSDKEGAYTGGLTGTSWNIGGSPLGYDASRGIQWSKSASTLTLVGFNSSYVITSITVTCSANATGATMSLTVGGNAFGTQSQSISNSNGQQKTFTNTTGSSGTVVVSTTAGSKSVYIKSVAISYSTLEPGVSYPASPTDQAKAWSTYYLSLVGEYCDASGNNSDVDGIRSVWTELNNEYSYMTNESKNAFVEGNDSTIIKVRDLYLMMQKKYNLTAFVTDGSGNIYKSASFNILNINNSFTTLLLVTGFIAGLTVLGYYFLRKRKEQ